MKRSFLRELGIEAEEIDKIMAEHGKSIENLKTQVSENDGLKEKLDETEQQLNKAQSDIEELGKSTGTIEELKEQLGKSQSDLETFKADTEKRETSRTKKDALYKALDSAGAVASSIDLLIPTFDLDKVQLDNKGNIVDIDDFINPVKDARKELFATKSLGDNTPPTNNNDDTDTSGMSDQEYLAHRLKKE